MDNDTTSSNAINAVELAADLTAAWLSNPNTRTNADDVPAFLLSIHKALSDLTTDPASTDTAEEPAVYTPAVTARKSLSSPDHIISMIDGKPYKTLRRHLNVNGMTPDEYRERYGLKADYPMVAPAYSESRRSMAHKIGLGRKPGQSNADMAADAPAADAPAADAPAADAPAKAKAPRKPRAPKADAAPADNG
jgi:predicted transcriptional regulator